MDSKPTRRSRGRPTKNETDAINEAIFVLEVATAISLRRFGHLRLLGFTQTAALRFVLKRRRGLTGDYIGTAISELISACENKTQAALRLVIEHDLPVARAAELMKIDLRNLRRLVPAARQAAQLESARKINSAAGVQIHGLN